MVERISDFLSQCSIRYCFQRPFNPLNRDLDDLFAAWVSNSSGGGGGSGASGLGGGSLDGELFNLEEEMESFMPLLLSHSSANAGRGAADNSSNSNYGGQGHQHNYQYRPGHSSSKSSADEPQPASATAASPACGNAWLSHSAAVRAAGPLAQRQHQSQPSQQAQQAQGLHGAQSGDSFEECL